MTVGMPGAAVGGLFYIVSAICMPLHAAASRLGGARGGTAGWRGVARQAAIALGIVAVTWLVGVLVALLLGPASLPHAPAASRVAALPSTEVMRQVAVVLSLGTLAAIVVGVEVLRLVVRPLPSSGRVSLATAPAAPHEPAPTVVVVPAVANCPTKEGLAMVGAAPERAADECLTVGQPAPDRPVDESLVCA